MIGRACEGLHSQASTSPSYLSNYTFEEASNLNVDIFEDGGYFNDGNEEDCYFTDDQGVEALKVYQV